MRKLFSCFVIFLLINNAKAQPPSLLADFGIQRVNDKILVSWEINSGNQCLGLQVEHSYDSINFAPIYDYQGICGAGSTNEKYDYLHSNPLSNSINYYRLKLGNGGYSKIESVKFVKVESLGYSLFPNPISQNSKLYFYNNNELFTLSIYSISGAKIYSLDNITDSEISLYDLFLTQGMYFFRLTNNTSNSAIKGKFIVQ